jgi:hypothetical protein
VARTPLNHRQRWTKNQISELKRLLASDAHIRVIALKIGRSEAAIRSKAAEVGLSHPPTGGILDGIKR